MKIAIIATMLLSAAAVLAQYTGGDTTGCRKTHSFNGKTQHRNVTSSGTVRTYGIHLPSNYSRSTQYPIIIGFHGSDSKGSVFEEDTKLSDSRFSSDKIVVYPDGKGGSWAGANYSKASVDEDLQFVWDLLLELRRDFCIDSARIYAAGFSNGGELVNSLACNDTVGREFAAFAIASGCFYTDNDEHHGECTPARSPTPILEFHGGADENVFYDGGIGMGGTLPSIVDWLGWWTKRNQCDTPGVQEDFFDGDVHRFSWTCHGQAGALQHYKTDDQKHDWPSTEINLSQDSAEDVPTHLQASALIQDFFGRFTRPAE